MHPCPCVCINVLFFFFFLERGVSMALCHTNRFRVLFIRPTNIFFSNFFIKNGSHITIHTFKNYFATVFSVFSKISGILTHPYYIVYCYFNDCFRVLLMSAFRTIVNKLFKKNDTTFIGNIKKCLKNEFFFLFP